jgi:hypothetical protein
MQLTDISDAHRPFVAAVVPDGGVHHIDLDADAGTYTTWGVDSGWLHVAKVTVHDPRPGRPESTRRAVTAHTVTRLEAIVQMIRLGSGRSIRLPPPRPTQSRPRLPRRSSELPAADTHLGLWQGRENA